MAAWYLFPFKQTLDTPVNLNLFLDIADSLNLFSDMADSLNLFLDLDVDLSLILNVSAGSNCKLDIIRYNSFVRV